MNKSMQQQPTGKINYVFIFLILFFFIDSWIDVELPTNTFMDRDLASSMHINENLLLEAQKESSGTSSHSDR